MNPAHRWTTGFTYNSHSFPTCRPRSLLNANISRWTRPPACFHEYPVRVPDMDVDNSQSLHLFLCPTPPCLHTALPVSSMWTKVSSLCACAPFIIPSSLGRLDGHDLRHSLSRLLTLSVRPTLMKIKSGRDPPIAHGRQ